MPRNNLHINNNSLISDSLQNFINFLDENEKSIRELNSHFQSNKILFQSKINIPVSIFRNNLSPLEAVIYYLHKKGLKNNKIGQILNRSNSTVWISLKNVKKKVKRFSTKNDIEIPIEIIADKNHSVLENICLYLRDELKLSFVKIAKLLNKNKNTVWTAYSRGVAKDA